MSGGGDLADGFGSAPLAIEVAAFDQWFSKSSAPEILYATGARQPRSAAVWHVAREYERAGLVTLRARVTDDGWQWIAARKLVKAAAASQSVSAKNPPVDDGGDDEAGDIIHRALKRAANFGQPAPSYRDLARAGGVTERQARSIVERLRRAGEISVQIIDGKRRVHILDAKGKVKNSTAWSEFNGAGSTPAGRG